MPITCTVENPFAVGTLQQAWAYCSGVHLDFATRTGRLVYSIHADKASAYSGKPPIRTVEFPISNTPYAPTIPAFDDLVAANATAYGLLLQSIDALALAQPEFADGQAEGA